MLPAYTSHLGFETTVTFAEEKMCLFKSKQRKNIVFILSTVTLQSLCKGCWSGWAQRGGGIGEALGAPLAQ